MTFEEFSKLYKLDPKKMVQPTRGIGLLVGGPYPSRDTYRYTVSIVGPNQQYMYVVFINDQYCLSLLSSEVRRLITLKEEERTPIVEYLNTILATLGSPVKIVYDEENTVFVLYNTRSNAWSFKLDYTFKTPDYNKRSEFLRVEAHTWQLPRRPLSNTLEGRFDPDSTLQETSMDSAVKYITETLT